MRSAGFRTLQYLCALLPALVLSVPVRAGDASPLLSAFQRLCVDTNAEPAKVIATALAAGAVQNPDADKDMLSYAVHTWSLRSDGLHLMISAESWRVPARAGIAEFRSNDCEIWIQDGANDIAAVENWTGVAPTPSNPRETFITYYDYQMDGAKRLPLPASETERRAIDADGRHWRLVVARSKKGASLILSHFLGPWKSGD